MFYFLIVKIINTEAMDHFLKSEIIKYSFILIVILYWMYPLKAVQIWQAYKIENLILCTFVSGQLYSKDCSTLERYYLKLNHFHFWQQEPAKFLLSQY